MKIGEILELTQTMKLSEIAKQYLDVGEKKALEGMKKAGCYAVSGKRGWYYDGDPAVLEQSIYDFTTKTINTRPKANGSNKTTNKTKKTKTESMFSKSIMIENGNKIVMTQYPRKKVIEDKTDEVTEYNPDFFEMTGEEVPKVENPPNEDIKRKRMSFDLDIELMKELKIQGIRDDVPLYEMVENAIRHYLDAKRH
ncbi:hypothetical protein [Exiguobacterium sp. s22]|uniref:hypothetical protein n=1 Tax=Exiguobacterium sp. s22 TaxID=2751272 RepID=UPI001BECD849|nr:hypothetical protein [Exiguobacterium sp. s22]